MGTLQQLIDITSILKEEIKKLHFVSEDVLVSIDDKILRRAELEKAMILGNGEKSKSKIVFATIEGLKKVETTAVSYTHLTLPTIYSV